MIETFPKDSPFLLRDSRKNRWAIPYSYEALNSRVENILLNNVHAVKGKRILDLGCHFGTFAYACLEHGADFVCGVDTEKGLIEEAGELFEYHGVSKDKYSFHNYNVISFLSEEGDNSFDTVLCLGLMYYLNDPFHLLKLMASVAKEFIVLDTFTAYYAACMTKEGSRILKSTKDSTFDLPIIFMPLTQASKGDYTLNSSFINERDKNISMLSLASTSALENFFRLLQLKFTEINWDKYFVNNYTWRDFADSKIKKKSHWADIYNSGLRVSYLLQKGCLL
ncbi:class I SAM-dependent methyltransferase [Spirochaetota bacterium]